MKAYKKRKKGGWTEKWELRIIPYFWRQHFFWGFRANMCDLIVWSWRRGWGRERRRKKFCEEWCECDVVSGGGLWSRTFGTSDWIAAISEVGMCVVVCSPISASQWPGQWWSWTKLWRSSRNSSCKARRTKSTRTPHLFRFPITIVTVVVKIQHLEILVVDFSGVASLEWARVPGFQKLPPSHSSGKMTEVRERSGNVCSQGNLIVASQQNNYRTCTLFVL